MHAGHLLHPNHLRHGLEYYHRLLLNGYTRAYGVEVSSPLAEEGHTYSDVQWWLPGDGIRGPSLRFHPHGSFYHTHAYANPLPLHTRIHFTHS